MAGLNFCLFVLIPWCAALAVSGSRTDSLKIAAASLVKECRQRDTTTPRGTRIQYAPGPDGFRIVWGDRSYRRTSDSAYTCFLDSATGVWDFVPKLHAETKAKLVFTHTLWTSSGGNPAPLEEEAILFPKNARDSLVEIPFFIDVQRGYLVAGDPHTELLHLLHLETSQVRTFTLDPKPAPQRSPTMPIRKVRVAKGKLTVQYLSLDGEENEVPVSRAFPIPDDPN